jgi:DNA repair protein RadC
MMQRGIETLTDVELLALFLRTGTPSGCADAPQALLQRFGSLYGLLSADKAFAGLTALGWRNMRS